MSHPEEQVLSRNPVDPYRPFDKVPSELLSHILTFAWSSYPEDDSPSRFSFPSAPSRVNRYFNHTVLSIPIIWSYLRITSTTNIAHIQERIQRRSGALPLDICIIFKDVDYDDAKQIMESTASSRCRTLTLLYPRPSILHIPFGANFWDHIAIFNEGNPLQVVHLTIKAETSAPLNSLPITTPSIRSLKISGWCLTDTPEISLPSSLEVLAICPSTRVPASLEKINLLLGGFVRNSLRSLSFSGLVATGQVGMLTEPCILDSLEYLHLEGYDLADVAALLGHILVPNLHHLSLKGATSLYREGGPNWEVIQLPNFRELTLQGFPYDPAKLAEFIQHLPTSVKSLKIIGDHPIQALVARSTTTFRNQIEHLIADHVHWDNLLSLVQGRLVPLQTFKLEFGSATVMPQQFYKDYTRNHEWSTGRRILQNSAKKFGIVGEADC